MKNGEPQDKVDLLLIGDGYTAAEMDKWHEDAQRLAGILFAVSPFKEHGRTSTSGPSTRPPRRAACHALPTAV